VAGGADLAGDDRPHRRAERRGDLGGNDDPAPGDAADDHRFGDVAGQPRAEATTRVDTVGEDGSVIHRYDPGTATRGIGMAISAYVLIQTEVGKAARVASAARAIDGVVAADDVTGPYDVIVRTEAPSLDDLGRLVVSQIQAVEGITRTFTCPVVNL
jgi:DNA-binding Lrp family transcriptional regulator